MIKKNNFYSHWLYGNVLVITIVNNASCIVKKEDGTHRCVASFNLKEIKPVGVPCPEGLPVPNFVAFTGERACRNDWQDEAMFANTYVSKETNYAKVDTVYDNSVSLNIQWQN